MYFPVAGTDLNPLIPVLVGAVISVLLGQVGLTGGIVTLPFMVSILNFTSPSVNSTNLVYVLTSTLGSIASYRREQRLVWRLGIVSGIGGIGGSLIGPILRVGLFSDPARFKTLFGVLMALIALRLLLRTPRLIKIGKVERTGGSFLSQNFVFSGITYTYSTVHVLAVSALAGMVSTFFGIGTGVLLIPFYTTILKLPIYAVAGSALLSTLMISGAGTAVYASLETGMSTSPDLGLGLLLGFGGVMGGFASAKIQPYIPASILQRMLGIALLTWAAIYLRHGF